ncbi:2',5' RNA ligase family [Planctomyces sp. SH-PL14]|nr:2',5' RNA ligase family [Planctomyces sp. SH-PL14]
MALQPRGSADVTLPPPTPDETPGTIRTFVGVPILATPQMVALHRQLQDLRREVRVVELRQCHLTLAFLGETPAGAVPAISGAIAESIRGVEPYSARLTGLGTFPDLRRPRVVWMGLAPDHPLKLIAARLQAALPELGLACDRKPFAAHVTLARVKTPDCPGLKSLLRDEASTAFGEPRIEAVCHYRSELSAAGPVYSILSEHPLTG